MLADADDDAAGRQACVGGWVALSRFSVVAFSGGIAAPSHKRCLNV